MSDKHILLLDAFELANDLFSHLEVVKSFFTELNQIRNTGWDTLAAEMATSFIVARDRDLVQLEQQIAWETARLERASGR